MRKILLHIMLFMAAAAVSSCIYPFEPEIDRSAGRYLVVEGDILIGEECGFSLGYMAYMDEDFSSVPVRSTVQVESESGKVYKGYSLKNNNKYQVNLRYADPSDRYRLHIILEDGREYASEWAEVRKPCVIDDITHEPDSLRGLVRFNLSIHSDEGEQYFRWFFDEDWEYKSLYEANVEYVINLSDPEDAGSMKEMEEGEGTHYCWENRSSSGLMFTTTRDLDSDRVTEKSFYRVSCQDPRLSILYAMTVKVESLTADCFDYWKNIKTNSDNVGDLFAPIPSEMRGNVYNLADRDEMVFGYVNVSGLSQKRIFVDNNETGYYIRNPYVPEENWPIPLLRDEWRRYYVYKQYLPISKGEGPEYYWAPKRCVDCRLQGGTKNRPDFWPNKHF